MDMTLSIAPKSDQLNYDDFLGIESKTIKITGISGSADPQQPVSINYEGDNGKPYKPCKSMRRVLVAVWGKDGKSYIGKSLTLYGDAKVSFGGNLVGGIRISHMSEITDPVTVVLSVSKAIRKPFTVKPLVVESKAKIELTPGHKDWNGAKKSVADGKYTVDQLRGWYIISDENEGLLNSNS